MPPETRLITARLLLRPVTPADRADLIALEADPQVMRYLNGGQPVPEDGLADTDFLTPRGTEPEVLAALDLASGRFLGWFALFDDGTVDGLRSAELGYRLARAAWGQGFGREGAAAMLCHALGPLGFDRVRAQTMTVNAASRRVMEAVGMRHVATIFPVWQDPIPGADQGEVIYEIRRGDA